MIARAIEKKWQRIKALSQASLPASFADPSGRDDWSDLLRLRNADRVGGPAVLRALVRVELVEEVAQTPAVVRRRLVDEPRSLREEVPPRDHVLELLEQHLALLVQRRRILLHTAGRH